MQSRKEYEAPLGIRNIQDHCLEMTRTKNSLSVNGLSHFSEQAQQSVMFLIVVGSQGSITSNQNQISVKSSNSEKCKRLAKLETQQKHLELKAKLIQHKTAMDIIEEQMELIKEEERIHEHENDDQVSQVAAVQFEGPQQMPKLQMSSCRIPEDHVAGINENVKSEVQLPKYTCAEPETRKDQTESIIAQIFSDSIKKSKLPAPTPPVFDGNPLEFVKQFFSL